MLRRRRIAARMRRALAKFRHTGKNMALRVFLISKARLGRWDARYCAYWGVSTGVTREVRRFITRGFAAGLVPTSTFRLGDSGSYHSQRRAADMGLRRGLIGTTRGLRRMRRFQAAEFRRRGRTRPVELIGPDNRRTVLRGVVVPLPEGSPVEEEHDNHVHGAF
jgi:hypothetical protein